MSEFQFTLIIPASGSGSRMKRKTPKPFLEIGGRSILQHTVEKFSGFSQLFEVIVATSALFFEEAKKVQEVLPAGVALKIVEGGRERQDSIYNALMKTDSSVHLVAIHDAVRPFIGRNEIKRCLETALKSGAAIVGIPAQDTIKKTGEIANDNYRIVETPDRSRLWNAQTPQIFHRDIIMEAYEYARKNNVTGTDDASLVENSGKEVLVVQGTRENFKITYPLDLQIAQLLMKRDNRK